MISIKKMITVGAAAGLMLGTAVPAFAGQLNFAHIWNSVNAVSNTGGNVVVGEVEDGSSTDTGNATTLVEVGNLANKNVNLSTCGCGSFQLNSARIGNRVNAVSNTGGNVVVGEVEDGSSTDTGNAVTGVLVTNVVNKNVSFGFELEN